MLDQLSYYPSPQGNEAASDIEYDIDRRKNYNNKIKEIIKAYKSQKKELPFFTEAMDLLVQEPPEFSLSAWHMGGMRNYADRVVEISYEKYIIKKQRMKKLRGLIRTIALVKRIYDDTLQRYYMPGGVFETNAAYLWNPVMKNDANKGFVKKIKQDVYLNRV